MHFLERFRDAVARGALKPDAHRETAAQRIADLATRIEAWRPRRYSLVFHTTPPRGLYLWGDVGRGKSMLMDEFFKEAAVQSKRRVHFNAFMDEVHAALYRERRRGAPDPVAAVARRMTHRLLCFDEFQVNDVADAMILGRLFEQLFARCVVVATSNTAPDRLYEDGLNRQLFLPFVDLIKKRMDVVDIGGWHDYRSGFHGDSYLTGQEADAEMDKAWHELSGGADEETQLDVLGRRLVVAHAANGVARFSFHALCARPLAAADYLAIARTYHTLLIDRIPVMAPTERDAARRFTVLIDTLYDEGVRLVCSAAAAPATLYPAGDGATAFKRTVSRLLEMRSKAYNARTKR
jgi:cell division protein ZapE